MDNGVSGFRQFQRVGSLTEEALARWVPRVPGPIGQVWREQGVGLVGDGFVRVVDPDRALLMLDGVVGLPQRAVPVFTTALADVVLWVEPLFVVVRFRFGRTDTLGFDAAQLVNDLQDDVFLDQQLAREPYPQGVARLGVPGVDECFGFVPLLALGGRGDAASLDRCGLWEHLAVVAQLTGPSRADSR